MDATSLEVTAPVDSLPSVDALVLSVEDAWRRQDFTRAAELLEAGKSLFPDDRSMPALRLKHRKLSRVHELIAEVKEAAGDSRFVQTLGAFREAAHLARRSPELEAELVELAITEAREFVKQNWRVAAALLSEAGHLHGAGKIPDEIRRDLALAERGEIVSNILAEVNLSASSNNLAHARERLAGTLQKYPDESELQVRLGAIDLAISRQKETHQSEVRARRLAVQRKALERIDDLNVLRATIKQLTSEWIPHRSEKEVEFELAELEDEGRKADQAAAELAEDSIQKSLDTCAAVLAKRPCFIIFLDLKEKAEAILATSEHIRSLFDEGQVTQAARLCRQATALYPHSASLRDLGAEIQQRHDQALAMVDQGRAAMLKPDFEAAQESFTRVAQLLPHDRELADTLVEEIQNHAHSLLTQDCLAARSTLLLAGIVTPNYEPPADLAQGLAEALKLAEANRKHQADLQTLADLRSQLELTQTRRKLLAVRKALLKSNLASSPDNDVSSAAAALIAEADEKVQTPSHTPLLKRSFGFGIAIGCLVALTVWGLYHRRVAPVPPLPAKRSLQAPITSVAAAPPLPKPLPPARQPEVKPKPHLPPPTLPPSSDDASAFSQERFDWDQAKQSGTLPALMDFLRRHPQSRYAATAAADVESLQWRDLDKSDVEALRAFASAFPNGIHETEAVDRVHDLLRLRNTQLEQSDWDALDKTSRPMLGDFLAKYPVGPHSAAASRAIAGLDHDAALANHPAQRTNIPPDPNQHDNSPSPAVSSDSTAVLSLISQLQGAWDSKDIDEILALQHNLDRKTLKAQFSQVQKLAMKISPVGAPEITGTHASVTCRRQANEVFTDGSVRQNPELLVTYLLTKRNGAWIIEGTR